MTRRLSDRIAVVGLALGCGLALGLGCGGRAEGPAWPKRHATEKDGGESLAPRLPASVIALEAVEDAPSSSGAEAAAGEAAEEASAASGGAGAGAASAGGDEGDAGTGEEPVTTEDIVIEIDEDGD